MAASNSVCHMCSAELEGSCVIETLAAIAVIRRQLLRHIYEAGSLIRKLQAIASVCVDVHTYVQVWDADRYMEQSLCVRERVPFHTTVTLLEFYSHSYFMLRTHFYIMAIFKKYCRDPC